MSFTFPNKFSAIMARTVVLAPFVGVVIIGARALQVAKAQASIWGIQIMSKLRGETYRTEHAQSLRQAYEVRTLKGKDIAPSLLITLPVIGGIASWFFNWKGSNQANSKVRPEKQEVDQRVQQKSVTAPNVLQSTQGQKKVDQGKQQKSGTASKMSQSTQEQKKVDQGKQQQPKYDASVAALENDATWPL